MNWVFVGHLLAFGLAAVASFASAWPARAIEHPDTRRGLLGLVLTSGIWAAAQFAYLVVPSVALKEAAYVLGLVAGIVSVAAWLYFATAYSGRSPRDAPYRRVVVAAIVGLVLLKVSNPLHHGYFTASMAAEPFRHLAIRYGTIHWLAMGLSYALAFVGFYMLVERFDQAGVNTRPLEFLALLTALPLLLDVVALETPWLLPLTYEPLGVAAFAVGTTTVYLGRFQSVQLAADVDDPVIVLDGAGRVNSVNDRAAALYPGLEDAAGERLAEARPELAAAMEAETVLEVANGEADRYFQVSSSPFVAGRTETGRMVILTEVTERERTRRDLERKTEQLALLNRIVRHDIRNEMSVLIGWAEILEERTDEDLDDPLDRVLGAARHVVDLTERAREFVDALDEDSQPETGPIDAMDYLESEMEKQRESHPEATIEIVDAPATATVSANEMIASVFRNLIGNAIENADRETVEIEIAVSVGPDRVTVRIGDDGPGIPDDRKTSVFEMGETTGGGSGIGLYLVKTLVTQFGGAVRVEDNEPRGSVFVVELPRPPEDRPEASGAE